jgi:putative hydrolase of the HAD superfamily
MKYSAVIFDLFGTLVESLSPREFERMLSEMASVLSVPSQDYIRLWNDTWEKRRIGAFQTLNADIEHICQLLDARPRDGQVSKAAEIRAAFARRILKKPRDEAAQTLTLLKQSGYKTGLISNCAADIPRVWPEAPLAALIDVPIFSCSVGLKKPDPQVYLLASERLAMPPRKCVYVADGSERELTGASGAGMHAVLFHGPDEDPYDEGLDRRQWRGPTVSSLGEIPKLLNRA